MDFVEKESVGTSANHPSFLCTALLRARRALAAHGVADILLTAHYFNFCAPLIRSSPVSIPARARSRISCAVPCLARGNAHIALELYGLGAGRAGSSNPGIVTREPAGAFAGRSARKLVRVRPSCCPFRGRAPTGDMPWARLSALAKGSSTASRPKIIPVAALAEVANTTRVSSSRAGLSLPAMQNALGQAFPRAQAILMEGGAAGHRWP